MIGKKLSPVLEEMEATLWEYEAFNGAKPNYTLEGFRASTKIFMSALLDKFFEKQQAEGVSPGYLITESKIMSMKQNEETKALQEEIRTLKAEKKELACRLSGLSSTLIQVLKVKSLRGCEVKNWVGFQNGNGTDVGQDIERLIKRAEREQKYLLTVKHE